MTEKCTVRFVPRENGLHKIYVRQNGIPLAGSPYCIMVGNVEADPSLVRVFGDGLYRGKTGEWDVCKLILLSEYSLSMLDDVFGFFSSIKKIEDISF